jgi:flagellar biosynthetic protein FliR
MIDVDLAELVRWVGSLMWALGRVGGLVMAAPVFGSTTMPVRIRVAVVVVLTAVLAPLAPAGLEPLSAAGMATMVEQVLVGAGMGFVLQLVFQGVALGGQMVGQSMSLGFAEVVNPAGGGSTPVLGQFYLALATLLFLAMDGHLRLIALLAASFHGLPPGSRLIDAGGLHAIAAFGGQLFAGAVRVALPATTALLVVNIGFAAISRAAPAMNLFAVGFPITICLGLVAVWLALRALPGAFDAVQGAAWDLIQRLTRG